MVSRWEQGETISSNGLKSSDPALAKKLTQLLGRLSRCDSVQYWHDQRSDETLPFVIFSLPQLVELKKQLSRQKASPSRPAKFKEIVQLEVEKKFIWLPEAASQLQRKLVEILVEALPELNGCSGFIFYRTRTQAVDMPKWFIEFKVAGHIIKIGSLVPARELIRGTSKRIAIVEVVAGIRLVAFRNYELDRLVARLVDLGLYTDEVAQALSNARAKGT